MCFRYRSRFYKVKKSIPKGWTEKSKAGLVVSARREVGGSAEKETWLSAESHQFVNLQKKNKSLVVPRIKPGCPAGSHLFVNLQKKTKSMVVPRRKPGCPAGTPLLT
jgi:hypothetical protein